MPPAVIPAKAGIQRLFFWHELKGAGLRPPLKHCEGDVLSLEWQNKIHSPKPTNTNRNPTINTQPKETRFLEALEALFTGAEVDGDSGFVNLMRMKREHFRSIRPQLLAAIDRRAPRHSAFREELFDKLYTFFNRHFCESGSIYFRHLPAFSKTYERVYEDGRDVALSWKTRMLYYVKSDVLVRSMPVELGAQGGPQTARRFYFDAAQIEHKKNNERREFVFTFGEVKREQSGRVVHLAVAYSSGGVKTKVDAIVKQSRQAGVALTADELDKAISVFKRQTEADFFINKDAKAFLREQFDLWVYQYIFSEQSVFEEKRIKQIQALKNTAYDIIDFIAQFEDELRRAWEKPKFARAVNYVVTLDKLTAAVVKKMARHKGVKAQVAEWRELGLVDQSFSIKDILAGANHPLPLGDGRDSNHPLPLGEGRGEGGGDGRRKSPTRHSRSLLGGNPNHQFLPLDTRHFKSLELEILDGLGNLDEALDGELVHSENWQALNSLRRRYAEKVKCVYIDPPYNTGTDFQYRDRFQDSSWLTLMENRLEVSRELLDESGHVYLQLDHYADYLGRILLQNVFPNVGKEDQTVITWNTGENISGFKTQRNNWIRQQDKILFFPKNPEQAEFIKLWTPLDKHKGEKIGWLDFMGTDKSDLYIEKWQNGKIQKINVSVLSKRIGTVWNDVYSFQYSEPRETESFSFQTQKPENLLRRMIQSCTHANDVVVDLFSGTGTTPAVAHKIGRRWLAIESDKHFDLFYADDNGQKKVGILGRMKIVLSGDKEFTLPNTPEKRNPHLSKDVNWEGGGAFKYYPLEQYEETLKNARYKDGQQLELDSAKSPFEQYIFCTDDKLAHAVTAAKGKLEIKLQNLYPDIDIAESLSNILGKPIRHRTADSVAFTDGTTEKTNPAKMTEPEKLHFISLLKPYLWWGE